MPILDGTIDKVLEDEKRKLEKYFKGAIGLSIELSEEDLLLLKKLDGEKEAGG